MIDAEYRHTIFTISLGDTLPTLREQLFESDDVEATLTGSEVFLAIYDHTGEQVWEHEADIEDEAEGIVEYAFQTGDFEEPGDYYRRWRVRPTTGGQMTVPNDRIGYPVQVIA